MSAYTQENRLLSIATPLGSDVLLLTGFSGSERLSRLFAYHLDLLSERQDITPQELVGKKVTWNLTRTGEEPRFFNGYVSRFVAGGEGLYGLRAYQIEVVPWLWFLTRASDCRIFHPNKTTPEIIAEIFEDFDAADFDDSKLAGGNFLKREYCVQYRETAFNFVSRLMEDEGIFYFWRHENGKHTLVLGRQKSDYADCPENEVPFSSGSFAEYGCITGWRHEWECRTGTMTHSDYNFETPKTSLLTKSTTIVDLPDSAALEIFDYPGEYKTKAEGDQLIRARMEEEETPFDGVSGESNCSTFFPGGKFTLTDHDVEAEVGKAYLLTSVEHSARDTTYGNDGDTDYSNTFTCIPATVAFRPARVTPKPVVHGAQTAVVVGPKGEEIHTDKYGRIKVQFHWDRRGKRDENSSCWMRVATGWAGKQWGMTHIPRVGQEVIIDFLEGDPDRPLVVGSVANAIQMPAYPLPQEKTKSYTKSNSSPGGEGFNEIRFEDKKDKEQIFIHAERNMDVRVKNNSMERVVGNRHLVVGWEKDGEKGGDQREFVWQDKHLHIKRDQVEQIEGNYSLTVGKGDAENGGLVNILIEKDLLETIEGNRLLHVVKALAAQIDGGVTVILNSGTTTLIKGSSHLEIQKERREKVCGQHVDIGADQKVRVTGDNHLIVTSNDLTKVEGTVSLTVGTDHHEKVGKNFALETGKEIHIKAGDKIIIEAAAQLSLKGPGGFVNIGPGGVDIQGTLVNINSGGSAASGSGAKPQAPKPPEPPDDLSKNEHQDAVKAEPTEPTKADNATSGHKSNIY